MKTHSWKVITIALMISLSAVFVSVSATSTSASISVEIPFDFQIGNTEYSKGKYRISRKSQTLLIIENLESSETKVLLGGPSNDRLSAFDESTLTFNRYGDQYFLKKINSPSVSAFVSESGDEKRAKKANHKKLAKIVLGGSK